MVASEQPHDEQTEGKNLNVHAEEAMLRGTFASLVSSTLAEHECTLDFVFVDPTSTSEEEPQGYLVSRVIIANTNLSQIADLLNRQVERLKERRENTPEGK